MVQYIDKAAPEHLKEKQGENPIYNVPSREVILAIWDLGNEWKELTNYDISTEHGTQLDYIQKRWKESEYYLRAKQGEKKPDNIIDEGKAEMDYCFTKMMKEEKVTPAWSEKDEEIISMLIELVEYKEESMEAKVEFIAWLKSLKDRVFPQNTWKPSDELIQALERSADYLHDYGKNDDDLLLLRLLEELKKLKEK